MAKIKVLSLPSRHPYTSKLNTGRIHFINPNSDLFSRRLCTPEYLNDEFPHNSYDIVHIHFSFDKLTLEGLQDALQYFKKNNKPIVWTLHSKESQRIRNYGDGKYQKLLFKYADKIICPTTGAKMWCESTLGIHTSNIEVIPLGFMSDPRDIKRLQKSTIKDSKLFTMLVGEFRQNKEFLQSVVNFLQCTDLLDYKLQLIFKPIPVIDENSQLRQDIVFFYKLVQNPRIEILSRPEITNDELNMAFLRSHAVIIAYKWGTHSGQIEQAKDCGCHAVVSNVGFYKEQWQDVCLYKYNEKDPIETARNYTNALIEIAQRPSIKPLGMVRLKELNDSVNNHVRIYEGLIAKFSN
ncbi:glycosyltransferase [Patescibacteria group bacterium]|nr:glycosyltransferase [Patescibacteria group bacterium]